ncbi:MAG: helix-turn-helix transcriptional regulator [Oscillospiraceae bacterium]|nr:helix-turn-helix transcriptional regulator [Oscillospiraceae bacterium]
MTREEFLSDLLKKQGHTIKGFARQIGLPTSTLRSILKNVGGAAVDNVFKICAGLGIKADDLNEINDNPIVVEATPSIKDGEQDLLDLYRQLHNDDKIRIVTKMETIIEDYPENKEGAS